MPRAVASRPTAVDRAYRGIVRAAATASFAIMGLIGLFLLLRSLTAWHRTGLGFFTEGRWLPDAGIFGISAVLVGTVEIALVALFFAVPLAFAAAVYISEYAAVGIRRMLISLVDLMAAIPSIVYALWGFFLLQPHQIGTSRWLVAHASLLPIFRSDQPDYPLSYASSTLIAGMVVALLVLPVICSIMREAFSQAPTAEREAAYALGSTRWGMIRTVVLPFGRAGVIGAVMLGLGRSLGETIAVYFIISPIFTVSFHIAQSGGNSISALIAGHYNESSQLGLSALMAAGLVLFGLTLAVNAAAAVVINRSRSGVATDL